MFMCLTFRTDGTREIFVRNGKTFEKRSKRQNFQLFQCQRGSGARARSLWLLIDTLLTSLAYKTPSTAGGKYNFHKCENLIPSFCFSCTVSTGAPTGGTSTPRARDLWYAGPRNPSMDQVDRTNSWKDKSKNVRQINP